MVTGVFPGKSSSMDGSTGILGGTTDAIGGFGYGIYSKKLIQMVTAALNTGNGLDTGDIFGGGGSDLFSYSLMYSDYS